MGLIKPGFHCADLPTDGRSSRPPNVCPSGRIYRGGQNSARNRSGFGLRWAWQSKYQKRLTMRFMAVLCDLENVQWRSMVFNEVRWRSKNEVF
jgi:hypothetical protein